MEFVLIASAHFLALLSPGPDFFLIVQAALKLPFRYSISVCAGIATANALYLVVAVLGLEAIRETGWLVEGLKFFGALYLLFVGIMLLKTKKRSFDQQRPASFLHAHHLGKQFLIGFMSGILNPKNVIFYLALFSAMVSETTNFMTRCLYGLWMTAVVFCWDSGVVMVVGRAAIKDWLGRSVFVVEKISGLALTIFGLLLPFT